MTKNDKVQLASKLLTAIDNHSVAMQDKPFKRVHLGASQIGDPCSRKLWYGFRKVLKKKHSGQKIRLINRGHAEEEKVYNLLRGIGATVFEVDPVTGKQYRFSGCEDHFGGSCDGKIRLPEVYGFSSELLLEIKTSNLKNFVVLQKQGVIKNKPVYYAQMCMYGRKFDLKYAIFFCVCKDNDSLYIEVVELDHELGAENERKAEDIVLSPIPPQKMSQDPALYLCKWCDESSVCHYGAPIDRNCLSCSSAQPAQQGTWYCNQYKDYLPKDFLEKGCQLWEPVC